MEDPESRTSSDVLSRSDSASARWTRAMEKLDKEERARLKLDDSNDAKRTDRMGILVDILAATDAKKQECMDKRWKVVLKGRTIIVRDLLEKVASWTSKLMTLGDVAISHDPAIASLPWAVAKLVLQVVVNDVEAFARMLEVLEHTTNVVTRCQIIELLQVESGNPDDGTGVSQRLSDSLELLYAEILRTLAWLLHYYRANKLQRLAKNLGNTKGEIDHRLSAMKEAEKNIDSLLLLAEMEKTDALLKATSDTEKRNDEEARRLQGLLKELQQPIVRIDAQISKLRDELERETRARILRSISIIPYATHHKTARKDRLEGSGKWFLEKQAYQTWRKDSSPAVLWLHGIPGSGKTKLASLVVDELLPTEHLAYFYCMRNPAEPERAKCEKILASLCRQLASPGVNKSILGPVTRHFEAALSSFEEFRGHAWTTDECAEVLLDLMTVYPAVTLSIDALDEVDEYERQELLDVLSLLLTKSDNLLKIFISSRENLDIVLHLKGFPNIYIDADDNAGDIAAFIDDRLDTARLLRGNLPDDLRRDIVEILTNKANGMFRWVDLQIQSLKPLKVASDVRARLGSLPATLETSYWEIYNSIQSSGVHAAELAILTFRWLLYAMKPIPLEDFAAIASKAVQAGISSGFTASDVLDVCDNLVVARNDSFEFAHLSVREFLERLSKRDVDAFESEIANAAIASACLANLVDVLDNCVSVLPYKGKPRLCDLEFRKRFGLSSEYDLSRRWMATDKGEPTEIDEIDRYRAKVLNDIIIPRRLNPKETRDELLARYFKKYLYLGRDVLPVVQREKGVEGNRYTALYWMAHIPKNPSVRRRSGLTDQLKGFLADDSSPHVPPKFQAWLLLCSSSAAFVRAHNYEAIEDTPNPLWLASWQDWPEVFEYLCRKEWQNQKFMHQEIWLYAMKEWKPALASALTKCGISQPAFHRYEHISGVNPLLEAAVRNDHVMLAIILQNTDVDDLKTKTKAILAAVQYGNCKVLEMLLDSGTPIERVGYDALRRACEWGHAAVFSLLIERGAPTEPAKELLYSSVFRESLEVVRVLLQRQIGLDGLDKALVMSTANGADKIATELLAHGAHKEQWAVHRAIRDKTPVSAVRLVKAGFPVPLQHHRAFPRNGMLLHWVVEQGLGDVLEALLERTDLALNQRHIINASRDGDGYTPLHIAAARGSNTCVATLLRYGGDVLAEDIEGQLPLDLAEVGREERKQKTESLIRHHMEQLLKEL